jgi:hypothetical protein
MGYELQITRAKHWPGSKSEPITTEEWLGIVERDPELRRSGSHGAYFALWNVSAGEDSGPWLDWNDGEIFAKNPDEALIEKMVQIAKLLRATVQGDDGELYVGGGAAPQAARQSAFEWVRTKFENVLWGVRAVRGSAERKRKMGELASSFHVGQRVKGVLGNEGVVTCISADEPPGLGKIAVRFGNGNEVHFSLAASGLSPLPPEKES